MDCGVDEPAVSIGDIPLDNFRGKYTGHVCGKPERGGTLLIDECKCRTYRRITSERLQSIRISNLSSGREIFPSSFLFFFLTCIRWIDEGEIGGNE